MIRDPAFLSFGRRPRLGGRGDGLPWVRCFFGTSGAFAEAMDGPRVIAAVNCVSCGQPLGTDRLKLLQVLLGPGSAPSSTIASPWTAIASGRSARAASALLGSGSPCRTAAASRRRARGRRKRHGCADRRPARSRTRRRPVELAGIHQGHALALAVRPNAGRIWSSGAGRSGRGKRSRGKATRGQGRQGASISPLFIAAPNMGGQAARRKTRQCRRDLGQQPSGTVQTPRGDGRFLHIP